MFFGARLPPPAPRVALRAATRTGSLRAPLQAGPRPCRLQVSAALHDPWATLGVSRDASEKEVKQAHRRLVKQHHPDVRKGEDLVAHAQFLRIQEAYELIMGKRAGKDVDGRPTAKSDWDFFDWFWSFKMKRKQGVREQAATFRSQWQAQMAGLKQKAAAKRWKRGGRRQAAGAGAGPAADSSAAGAAAGAGPAGSSAARERVWRSMTKNARNADKAAAERAATQQAFSAAGRSAPQAVGAGSQQQQRQRREEEAPPQQRQQRRRQPQQAMAEAAASHQQHHAAADAADGHEAIGSHSSSSSRSHAARLRQLMEEAAALMRGRQPGAGDHAAPTDAQHAQHAQPEAAGHSAPGKHWRGHMRLDQLASLLGGGSAGNAVPADEQLHRRFEAARRAQQGQQRSAAPSEQAEASAEDGAQAEAEPQHGHQQQYHHEQHQQHYGSAHARKFANRGDVEERLSSQLAGLKRRAALKQEVQSSC